MKNRRILLSYFAVMLLSGVMVIGSSLMMEKGIAYASDLTYGGSNAEESTEYGQYTDNTITDTTLEGDYVYDYETLGEGIVGRWRDSQGVVYELHDSSAEGQEPTPDQLTAVVYGYDICLINRNSDGYIAGFEPAPDGWDKNYVDIVIPETVKYGDKSYTVTEIRKTAFKGNHSSGYGSFSGYTPNFANMIGSIELPDTIKKIGQQAIASTGITELVIPPYVEKLDERSFSDNTRLKTVEFQTVMLENTPYFVFEDCYALETVNFLGATIDGKATPVKIKNLGHGMFHDCESLKEIEVPESVVSIDTSVFANNKSLKKITIPAGVTYIAEGALADCVSLEEIIVAAGNEVYSVENNMLITTVSSGNSNDTVKKVIAYMKGNGIGNNGILTIPKDLELTAGLFSGMDDIKQVVFEGDINVAGQMFSGCQELTDVIFKGNAAIGRNAFYECGKLKNVTFNKRLSSLDSQAFAGTGIEEFTIPVGCTYINYGLLAGDYSAFEGCESLKKIKVSKYLPASYLSDTEHGVIGNMIFMECPALESFEVIDTDYALLTEEEKAKADDYYYEVDGYGALNIVKKTNVGDTVDYRIVEAYPLAAERKEYVVGDDVKMIAPYAFYKAPVDTITFRQEKAYARYVENRAFMECKVKKLDLCAYRVGEYAFYNCTELDELTIADDSYTTTLEQYIFSGCSGIKEVVLPSSVTAMSRCIFDNCTNLAKVTLPTENTAAPDNTYKVMDISVFWNCEALEEIVIPENIVELSDAFDYCNNLKKIIIEGESVIVSNFSTTSVNNNCVFVVKEGSQTETNVDTLIAAGKSEGSSVQWTKRYDNQCQVDFYNPLDDSAYWTNFIVKSFVINKGSRLGDAEGFENIQPSTQPGYIFKGWYIGEGEGAILVNADTVISEDTVISAVYESDPNYIYGYILYSDNQNKTVYIRNFNGDILSPVTVGNGTLEYDKDTNVLTMTNVNLPELQLIIDGMDDITLKVVGDNVINSIQKIKSTLSIDGTSKDSLTLKAAPQPSMGSTLYLLDASVSIGKDVNVTLEKGMSKMLIDLSSGKNLNYSGDVYPEPVIEDVIENNETVGYMVNNDRLVFGPLAASLKPTPATDESGASGNKEEKATEVQDSTTGQSGEDTQKEEKTTEVSKQDAATEAPKIEAGTETKDESGATYTVKAAETGAVEVEYTAADTTEKTVKIPSTVTVNGVEATVTTVAASAFEGNKTVTTVSIPSTVEEIGDNAFKGCANLTTVTIPVSVEEIGDSAFQNCTKLKKVTIPKNVETVGKNAFAGCSSLTTVDIKSTTITKIDQGAFKNCKKLTKVTVTKNVTTIGKEAFSGDKKLKTITIKSTKIKSVGKNAFKGVPKSTTIKVPKKQKAAYTKLLKKAGFKGKIK